MYHQYMRIIYSRIDFFFFFWNINSTILHWLIYTFSSQLNTFYMLLIIPCFYKGKDIHNPNDPLQYFCMLGFLGCEMCLFRKLYVEEFVDSFGVVVFHLVDLESIIVIVFPHHLIHITVQLLVHILLFCPLLCWLKKDLFSPSSLILYKIFVIMLYAHFVIV